MARVVSRAIQINRARGNRKDKAKVRGNRKVIHNKDNPAAEAMARAVQIYRAAPIHGDLPLVSS